MWLKTTEPQVLALMGKTQTTLSDSCRRVRGYRRSNTFNKDEEEVGYFTTAAWKSNATPAAARNSQTQTLHLWANQVTFGISSRVWTWNIGSLDLHKNRDKCLISRIKICGYNQNTQIKENTDEVNTRLTSLTEFTPSPHITALNRLYLLCEKISQLPLM